MKTIALILILAFALPTPARAQDGGTGGAALCARVVVGVLVIVIGSVAGCKVWNFCERKFPRDDKPGNTNDPPSDLLGGFGGSDVDVAALPFGEHGSCPQECTVGAGGGGETEDNTTTFTLSFQVDGISTNGQAILTQLQMSARRGVDAWQDLAGFTADARRLGVRMTGHAGDFSFARNGQPITTEQSPIGWDATRRVVTLGRGSERCLVFVERSEDLLRWTQVLSVDVEVGMTLKVQDAGPGGGMFYRVWGARD